MGSLHKDERVFTTNDVGLSLRFIGPKSKFIFRRSNALGPSATGQGPRFKAQGDWSQPEVRWSQIQDHGTHFQGHCTLSSRCTTWGIPVLTSLSSHAFASNLAQAKVIYPPGISDVTGSIRKDQILANVQECLRNVYIFYLDPL
jgi:hypothetical protein